MNNEPLYGTAFVAAQIVARYANPARTAYLYLFQVVPDADLTPIPPIESSALHAWLDEGDGLMERAVGEAIARCCEAAAFKPRDRSSTPNAKMTPHERRQMMARLVVFSVNQTVPGAITVRLLSRPLVFSPRGDRLVTEAWRRSVDGVWYSAPVNPDDRSETP